MGMFISNLSNVLIFALFCRMSIGDKIKKKVIFYLPIIVLFLVKMYFSRYFSPIINLGLSMLLYTAVLIFFENKLLYKLLLLIIYMCFSMISEELGLLVVQNIFTETIIPDSYVFYILIFISRFFLLMFVTIADVLLYTVKSENVKWIDVVCILIFPLSTIFSIVVSKYQIYIEEIDIGFLLSIIFFLIAILINCIELYRIQRNAQIRVDYEVLKEKQKNDKEYYDLLLRKSEKERQIMHDVNKHDQYLSLLLNESRFDKATAYLKQNMDNRTKEHIIVTQNKTLDLILEMYKDTIAENKIVLDISYVSKVDLDAILEIDQCTIFANVIENAIESCIRSEDKNIFIFLNQDYSNRIIFKLENSCDQVFFDNEQYKTLKEDGFHGFGLKNVKQCITKYDGILKVSHNGNMFTTIIVFQ